MRGYYRHTKIIATLGPATESRESLSRLILSGLDVMRLNMAHGSGDWVTSLVRRIRETSIEAQRHVAVMMDVKAPKSAQAPSLSQSTSRQENRSSCTRPVRVVAVGAWT
jgi:pyruvate kinase